MEQRVINLFHESIEARMAAGEALAPVLVQAGERIVQALLNDRKLLVCGNGVSSALGQMFTATLLNRLERERPSLPAISLAGDTATLTAISDDGSYNDAYAKQVRALGHPGDLLVAISTGGNSPNLVQAAAAAHDRDMVIIALTGRDGGDIAALLTADDIELRVPARNRPQIHDVHTLLLFALCDLIDYQLFGALE